MEQEQQDTQIVEINGVKLEVDMRHAKVIHNNLRVGSKVKVMITTYSSPEVHPGVIVGFDMFPKLPTIIVCYVVATYNDVKLEFAYINSSEKSKEKYTIIPALDDDLPISRQRVHQYIDKEVAKKTKEIEELEQRRQYFENTFGAYFREAELAGKEEISV